MTSAVDRPGQVPLRDVAEGWPVVSATVQARGPIVTLRSDLVRMPDGDVVPRQVVQHPGAVAVVALDEVGQVLLIRQYRHPVGRLLWEVPAGLRDVAGEPLHETAARELLEETGYAAADWRVLTDYYSSPGISTERIRVFLARELRQVPAGSGTTSRRTKRRNSCSAGWTWIPRCTGSWLVTCTMASPRWVSCPRMPLVAAGSRASGPRTRRKTDQPAAAGPAGLGASGNGAGRRSYGERACGR